MGNFQEVFLIILSLFATLKLTSVLFIHETFLVYKLETFTNCKEVKHIMIMIIAIIHFFFLLWDIGSTVENYYQKILNPYPWKDPAPFLLNPPRPTKNSKSASLLLFANIENFSGPYCRQRVEDTMLSLVIMVSFFPILV